MDGSAGAAGVWLVVVGIVLIVAALLERRRYRSEAADRSGLPIGPGGGEPLGAAARGALPARPTRCSSTRPADGRMRVWLDGRPASDATAPRTETPSAVRLRGRSVTQPCYPRRPGRLIGDRRFEEAALHRWPPSNPALPPIPAIAPRPRRAASRRRRRFPYLNRELSWLEFNARVLYEARDERNPLLERVKFLAIFAGNLDEFFQVRVAGLRQQVAAGKVARSPDGRTAEEQLAAARERVLELDRGPLARPTSSIRRALAAEGIELVDYVGDPGAPRRAPAAVPRRDLPGPDAARGRSRPPVPVHLDAEPVDRGRAARPGDRRAPLRPGQGAADPAAPARGRSRRASS